MGLREDLNKKIERKRQEIGALELQVKQAAAYLEALEDTLKMLPREGVNEGHARQVMRPNSSVSRAHAALVSSGKPLHINNLLTAIGKEPNRANQGALNSSLSVYVRKGEIFTRPAPNTYGLLEFDEPSLPNAPPPGFGHD